MRANVLERMPVIVYGLGLVAAGRLLGEEAHPLVAALVPASVIILGLVLPFSPVWVRRSLVMLAGGTFILGATSGAFFAAGGGTAVGAPRWLAVLIPALYTVYLSVGIASDEPPRDPPPRLAATASELVDSGFLVWVAAACVVVADAVSRSPPTPNDIGWLALAGAGLIGAGTLLGRVARSSPPTAGGRPGQSVRPTSARW